MIQPKFDEERKQCMFLTENNLCELHTLNLKPTEGRLANCKLTHLPKGGRFVPFVVNETWHKPEAEAIINEIAKIMLQTKGC
jgi:hypothetical protein